MITKGVFIALIIISFAAVVGVASRQRTASPSAPASSPHVAAETINIGASIAPVIVPQGTANSAASVSTTITSKVQAAVVTPSPTLTPSPAPSPTPKKEGNWTVNDTGKDSNPREASISYESEDSDTNASVNVSQSTSFSGNATVDNSVHMKVTVDGQTQEINN